MSMFHIGQKVVCIDDNWRRGIGFETRPVKGRVYTVRGIDTNRPGYVCTLGLLLEEIVNPPGDYDTGFEEASFASSKFRPVRETNIDIFTAMLAPQPLEPVS